MMILLGLTIMRCPITKSMKMHTGMLKNYLKKDTDIINIRVTQYLGQQLADG